MNIGEYKMSFIHFTDWMNDKMPSIEIGSYINEGSFGNPDWDKRNREYPRDLLDALKNGKDISYNVGTVNKPIPNTKPADEFDIVKLEELINDPKSTAKDFEQITKEKIPWTKIDKKQFSSKNARATATLNTAIQECVQGFAIENSNLSENELIRKLYETFTIGDGQLNLKPVFSGSSRAITFDSHANGDISGYIDAAVKTAKAWKNSKLKKIKNIMFTHPGMLGSIANYITGNFKECPRKKYNITIDKDCWNPADVFIDTINNDVKKFIKLEEEYCKDKPQTVHTYNAFLNDCIKKNILIPVSLKINTSKSTDSKVEEPVTIESNARTKATVLAKKFKSFTADSNNDGIVMNVLIDYKTKSAYDFTFRVFAPTPNKHGKYSAGIDAGYLTKSAAMKDFTDIDVTELHQGNKSSRLGKAVTALSTVMTELTKVPDNIEKIVKGYDKSRDTGKMLDQLFAYKKMRIANKTFNEKFEAAWNLCAWYLYLINSNTDTKADEDAFFVYTLVAAKKENYGPLNCFAPFYKIS